MTIMKTWTDQLWNCRKQSVSLIKSNMFEILIIEYSWFEFSFPFSILAAIKDRTLTNYWWLKVKLKFFALVLVSINVTGEIFCIQKGVGNLLVSQETKERTRNRPTLAEKTGKEPSSAFYVTLVALQKTLTQQNSPKRLSITHSFNHKAHSHFSLRLQQYRNSTVNSIHISFLWCHSTFSKPYTIHFHRMKRCVQIFDNNSRIIKLRRLLLDSK